MPRSVGSAGYPGRGSATWLAVEPKTEHGDLLPDSDLRGTGVTEMTEALRSQIPLTAVAEVGNLEMSGQSLPPPAVAATRQAAAFFY